MLDFLSLSHPLTLWEAHTTSLPLNIKVGSLVKCVCKNQIYVGNSCVCTKLLASLSWWRLCLHLQALSAVAMLHQFWRFDLKLCFSEACPFFVIIISGTEIGQGWEEDSCASLSRSTTRSSLWMLTMWDRTSSKTFTRVSAMTLSSSWGRKFFF